MWFYRYLYWFMFLIVPMIESIDYSFLDSLIGLIEMFNGMFIISLLTYGFPYNICTHVY